MKQLFIVASLAVVSFVAGCMVHSTFYVQYPWPKIATATSILYRSEVGSDLALTVDSKGAFSFGKEYDREAEARKLLEVAKRLADSDKSLPCTNANYQPPVGGVLTIKPGTAWPQLTITQQDH